MLDKIVGKSAFKKCVGEVLRTVSDQSCQIISILDRKLNSGTCSIAAPADSTYLITLLCCCTRYRSKQSDWCGEEQSS